MNRLALSLLFTAALISCQSAPEGGADTMAGEPNSPEVPAVPDQFVGVMNSISVGDEGLKSPVRGVHNYTTFLLYFDTPAFIRSWLVEWVAEDGRIVFSLPGKPPFLPHLIAWDGRTRNGGISPPGTYEARLSVDYGTHGGIKSTTTVPFQISQPPPPSNETSPSAWDSLNEDETVTRVSASTGEISSRLPGGQTVSLFERNLFPSPE